MGAKNKVESQPAQAGSSGRALLWQRLRELDDPAYYLQGGEVALSCLPQSILLFPRLKRKSLSGTPSMHFRYVLICCLEGAGGVILDGRLLRVRPMECLLIFPSQSHFYIEPEIENPLWLFTTFEYAVGEELLSLRERVFSLLPEDIGLIDRWSEAWNGKLFTECAANVCGLLSRLLRRPATAEAANGKRRTAPRTELATWGEGTEVVGKVSEYVRTHLREDCSLTVVAEAAGLSESRLRAVFRKAVGIPLGEYIRRTRIYQACQHLEHGGHNVTQAGEECGFSSVYAFSRSFRQVTGVSPKQFCRSRKAR